jgi:hypothetical protein
MSIPNFQIHREKISANTAATPAKTRKQVLAGASCPSRANQFTGAKNSETLNYEQEKDYPVCKPYGSTAALSVWNDQ